MWCIWVKILVLKENAKRKLKKKNKNWLNKILWAENNFQKYDQGKN